MIEGITILNQTEIMDISDAGFIWTLILVIGGLIGCILFAWLISVHEAFLIGVILCILAFFSGIIVCEETRDDKPSGRYQYEVTIDESVNFKDLYEQYDIVKQRGEIYILEDKEKMSE